MDSINQALGKAVRNECDGLLEQIFILRIISEIFSEFFAFFFVNALLRTQIMLFIICASFLLLFLFASSGESFQSSKILQDKRSSFMSSSIDSVEGRLKRNLPERLIVGYANWNECDDNIVQAAINGVNVIIWFSINLLASPVDGRPIITNGPDMDCVGEKVQMIRELGLDTVHLISIGGWNSPHPDTTNTAEVVYAHWNNWNQNFAARPKNGFFGFDGFDWDIEGAISCTNLHSNDS